ncbi:MAG: hypothetical protein CMF45_04850 [Legionellales bacterium]|nr:hypothetical protein [Legionellales bacterium]|tara:strand:- start:41 stop:379 length:339 start_codon:yes stop_codon:yes gene_type:complete
MATVQGEAIAFGVSSATGGSTSILCQSYSITTKQEQKELKKADGEVCSVAYFKKVDDISVEFIGAATGSVGSALSSGYHSSSADEVYIDEISTELGNEAYKKTSIKATGYYS